jgi:hypothetical protein
MVRSQPQANSLGDPISKNPSEKRAGGVAQGVGPEFKHQYWRGGKSVNLLPCPFSLWLPFPV